MKFIILDADLSCDPRNRTMPVILSVPEDITPPDEEKSKNLVMKAVNQKFPGKYRWNRKIALSEADAKMSPEIGVMFGSVDWPSVPKIWLEMPENQKEASEYVEVVGPAPSVEHLIAKDTNAAYRYAMDILEAKFPMGEEAIGRDPIKSINYATKMRCRIIPGEESMSKVEKIAVKYGSLMKNLGLWKEWSEQEVSRSPVWMYQYAKDHVGGTLPDSLHNRMHMLGFSDYNGKWAKKYIGAKKYMSKKK